MNEHRTAFILQRLPVILAVTAASYGLTQTQAARPDSAAPRVTTGKTSSSVPRRAAHAELMAHH